MKKTKIIATIWPSSNTLEKLIKLYKSWVNIIRFNFSHANYEESLINIENIKRLNRSWLTNLSLLLDTKWPEIRTWDLENKITYLSWDIFKIFVDKNKLSWDKSLFCDYEFLINDVNIWQEIIIDSGLFITKVISKNTNYVEVEALNWALIGSRRHINLPWIKLSLPWVTQKDIDDINFALDNEFDFIAASFIRNKSWIDDIRKIFESKENKTIKLISKIENQEAIDNLDDIIKYSDWLMVARWDLWIEVPIEKLALYQKDIVNKSKALGKFVIIATHLLESMIDNPFPTRAETSDIFNSVLEQTDCLMLSWETAMWKYPVEAVKMMVKVIEEAEKSSIYKHSDYSEEWLSSTDIEKKALIRAWIFVWEELWAKAMIILTKTWLLAHLTAAFRPNIKVYAFTKSHFSVWFMNSLYWINPIFLESWSKEDYSVNLENSLNYLKINNLVNTWDKVIAINDLQKDWKEIAIMEIINL